MEVEMLRRVFADISGTLTSLRLQINEADRLLEIISLSSITSELSSTGSGHEHEQPHTASSSRLSEMERCVKELETNNRELREGMAQLLNRHARCEAEINRAERSRNGMIRKYRILVRVAAGFLQRVMRDFPDEDVDEIARNAVEADLRYAYSARASSSSSNDTARPKFKGAPRYSGMSGRSPEGHRSRAGRSSSNPRMDHTSSTYPQLPTFTDSPAVGPDGLLLEWKIHTGSNCPASVKVAAGPFEQKDFVKLGIDKPMLEGILYGLIHSNDVEIRIASPSLPLQGFPDARLVFLYDPWYLESGLGTYILDWATPSKHQAIKDWLRDSSCGDEDPVFHTFTFSKKKGRWYYFGGMRWSLPSVSQPVWPTLVDGMEVGVIVHSNDSRMSTAHNFCQSRATILQHLSERSHGRVAPEALQQQIESGDLEEVSINISAVDERGVMEEIASRLDKRLKVVKPFFVRGDQ